MPFFPRATFWLPEWIYYTKALTNPGCEEKDSFKYSVIMQLFPFERHTERVSKKMKQEAENWKFYFEDMKLEFDFEEEAKEWEKLSEEEQQINFFEKYNNPSVSVFQKGPAKTIVPYYISPYRRETHFVLFTYLGRFFRVRNLSRFLGKKGRKRKNFCKYCLAEMKYGICEC